MDNLPIVGAMMGDPCGVGPEVSLKAIALGSLGTVCRPLLIGSLHAAQLAKEISGLSIALRAISKLAEARFEAGVIDVLDPGNLIPQETRFGQSSAACGKAVVEWINLATELGRRGEIAAWVMAPLNSEAIKLAHLMEDLDDLQPPGTYVFRMSGNLRVVPISEHLPIREVPAAVTQDNVFKLIELLHATLCKWGMESPRIGVAGLNPHAMGVEEKREISPAIEQARARDFDVSGPVSPDAIFRQCIEGKYDAVISMYHDQGQVAVKTAAFEGACSVFIGLPYVHLSIPHGSAYDIAGKGIAQHQSMLAALRTAAALGAGKGFDRFGKATG